ncbi:MAG TPA: hypothetical protein PL048_10025 [Leptospiraceae bacterium]|nr:hypothetical protein [Leptospiraceae bacterium]HMY67596.1 hypothetical protein [Leptospiraceae bacterium]HMZ59103.1 hypothetical protein [Leptospiraceae bacterium]HNF16570.1 hypothetical protein [Leptospiraceae bacterium]HNF24138.1 hypothetical protein [Leptospiraceae bacterium]
MRLIFEESGVATIHRVDADRMIILKWLKFNAAEEFKTVLNNVRDAFAETKYARVLVDTSETKGMISAENQKWMEELHFPKLLEQNICKYVATVVPGTVLGQMTTEQWQDNLTKIADMELINVKSSDEGISWLKGKK